MEKKRVVVVDDSAFMRKAISDMIESEPEFQVIAKLRDGRDLIEKIDVLNPDIITLDVHMKDLDGLATLKELKKMGKNYPIIMLSSATREGSEITLECLNNGAISFINKPSGSISLDIDKVQHRLIEELRTVSGSVNCRSNTSNKESNIQNVKKEIRPCEVSVKKVDNNAILNKVSHKRIDVVVIGASTGGPKALQEVLTKIPGDIGVPVLVVQHMPEGFTKVFAERLNKVCHLKVTEAEDGEDIKKNTIYIAKGGYHMVISRNRKIELNKEPSIWGVRPAVDKLFNSAINCYGSNILSVVLTGMGRDGADGTKNIKNNGGVTLSEDKSTCTIYGMPKAAYETGKVDLVIPLDKVADNIVKIVKGL